MKLTNFFIERESLNSLEKLSKKQNRNRSEIIRHYLNKMIELEEFATKKNIDATILIDQIVNGAYQ